MTDRYLFGTAIPVLLDGGRLAGRAALYLRDRYGLDVHWFGHGWHPLIALHAHRHPTLPITKENDGVTVRLLLAFAKEKRRSGGILALVPCSPAAVEFLARVGEELEEDYVLLDMPAPEKDPICGLLRTE